MKVFLAALLFLGIGVLAMCVRILLKKDGRFSMSDVGESEEMRRRGIRCMKEVDEAYFAAPGKGKKSACTGTASPDCAGCAFYQH